MRIIKQYKCPKCGQSDQIEVSGIVHAIMKVDKERYCCGWDYSESELDFSDQSTAVCLYCDSSSEGTLRDFQYTEPTPTPDPATTDPKRDLINEMWWFIENVNEDDPARTSRFFALRERVRLI